MAAKDVDLSDYVPVPERIVAFRAQYPEGVLTRLDPGGRLVPLEFVSYAGSDWVIYTAFAYREPMDNMPGVGTAWEVIPGRTPYTRGSEIQNAETSAWGRAIIAVGAADASRIASREEVVLAQARQHPAPGRNWITEAEAKVTADEVLEVWRDAKSKGAPDDTLDLIAAIGAERRLLEEPLRRETGS